MTVADCLAWGRSVLERNGIAEHRKEVEFLLADSVGRSPKWIVLNRHHQLPKCTLEEFRQLVILRASGTPIQYLIGMTEFFGLEIKVGRGVYIPKQETELLVEEALKYLGTPQHSDLTWGMSPNRANVHEVGTGSGAIAISIARHAPIVDIMASDISAFALSLARENSHRNGVAGQVSFCLGDLQDPLPGVPDLVVANLPYIRGSEDANLPRVVRAQPRSSLFSNSSGLGHIRRLLKDLKLRPAGRALLEIGFDQAQRVESLCAGNPRLRYVRTVKDLAGLDRIAVISAS